MRSENEPAGFGNRRSQEPSEGRGCGDNDAAAVGSRWLLVRKEWAVRARRRPAIALLEGPRQPRGEERTRAGREEGWRKTGFGNG